VPHWGFEPTIPVFERAKTVHALDRVATVIRYMMKENYFTEELMLRMNWIYASFNYLPLSPIIIIFRFQANGAA
jgi:hypothetical protein